MADGRSSASDDRQAEQSFPLAAVARQGHPRDIRRFQTAPMTRLAVLLLATALLAACHSSDAPQSSASGGDAEARVELERVKQLEDGCCKSTE
jgi:hypothetical protein